MQLLQSLRGPQSWAYFLSHLPWKATANPPSVAIMKQVMRVGTGCPVNVPSPFILCTGQVVHWLLFRSTAFASQSTTADLCFLLRLLSLWYCELGERKCEDQGSLLEQTGSRVPKQFLSRRQEWERNASSERLAFLCLILMPVAVGLPSLLFYFFQINIV